MVDAVANQLSADIFMAMPNRSRWLIYGKLDSNPPIISEMGQFVFSEKIITKIQKHSLMRRKNGKNIPKLGVEIIKSRRSVEKILEKKLKFLRNKIQKK